MAVAEVGAGGQNQSFPKWNRGKANKTAVTSPLPTSHLALVTVILPGTHVQTGFLLTPTKQTTVALSNRYKKPPPGGVPSGLSPCFYTRLSNRYTVKTGFLLNSTKQTTVVLSNRYKKSPPGEGTNLQPLLTPRPQLPVLAPPPSPSSVPQRYSGISLPLRAYRGVFTCAPRRGTASHPAHWNSLVLGVLGWSFTGTARPLTRPQVVGKLFDTANYRPQRLAGSRKLGSGTRRALLFQSDAPSAALGIK
jgi:hypothetical protein